MKHWIVNSKFDSTFILLPHFIGVVALLLFPDVFQRYNETIPVFAWVILIMCIDVAHVYSTLFRTYFDKSALVENQTILTLIPFIGLTIGIVTYSIDSLLFWRLLAYTAVFHFIRQQYGFLRLYLRKDQAPEWSKQIDAVLVYAYTLLPILIWHFSGLKNFNWFVENDFFYYPNSNLQTIGTWLFYIAIVIFTIKETYLYLKHHTFNLPKIFLLFGTAATWFIGIVLLNGDLAFTFLNVVSHGIPYMALVWYYGNRNYSEKNYPILKKFFTPLGAIMLIAILIAFAYVEEGLWDGFIWKEHATIFTAFNHLPDLADSDIAKLIVPLLTLPQLTHYILDGFIWKIGKDNFYWKQLD